jgi:hypothetical protein
MREYEDNKEEVKAFLKDFYNASFIFEPDVIAPDPHVDFV